MKERLTRFLQQEQLTPARFADILGVQRSGISHIMSGRNKPGYDLIKKITIKFPELNVEWLITGKGLIYKESLSPTLPEDHGGETQQKPISEITEIPEIKDPNTHLDVADIRQTIHSKSLQADQREILKIVILYTDKSFAEYHPE